MRFITLLFLMAIVALAINCNSEDDGPQKNITVISSTINGGSLTSGVRNVAVDVEIAFVFSNVLVQSNFEAQVNFSGDGQDDYRISYSNGGTRAVLSATLEYETDYNLSIGTGAIGQNGERLASSLNYLFTTAADEVIREQAPCTSTSSCLRSVQFEGTNGSGAFEYYSNYPIYEENASWENLKQAVFVIHGASHNADDYYSYLVSTLGAESLAESTVLISPFFRNTPADSESDFYWSGINYRDGDQSSNSNKISSFEVMDLLITQLANKSRFPVLEKIIITGQSSGGRFTHLYAPANTSENTHSSIDFEYIVSESQYFYYPDQRRVNETTNQLYTPTGCFGFDNWPFGYKVTPPYLTNMSETTFNNQFVNRSIHYLLGSGAGNDSAFNTSDCSATLLGSSRFQRGENMFRYMELAFSGTHNHTKTVVPGVAHNGSQIYQSNQFKALLNTLISSQ